MNGSMIPIEYVIAFAMGMINTTKKVLPSQAVPFVTIVLAVLLNMANAALVGADLLPAGQQAFVSAGLAVGLFVGGDAMRKASWTPMKTNRDPEDTN